MIACQLPMLSGSSSLCPSHCLEKAGPTLPSVVWGAAAAMSARLGNESNVAASRPRNASPPRASLLSARRCGGGSSALPRLRLAQLSVTP
eukprot:scaffold154152_cov28-Tisochrysis_lutea.AAC.3